jgi:hypothetical protein
MTSNLTCQLEQSEIALGIKAAGWRQGCVFLPNENIELPFFFDSINEVLIVISQSCSVVSPRFDADPFVEAIAAKKIAAYNERAPEATGKNQRKLHIKLSMKKEDCTALECDINRRFNFDRKKLLDLLIIQEFSIQDSRAKKIATCLGRYYTRIALPDELVKSMKKHLLPVLEKSLKKDSIHFEVDSIYITYESQFDTGFFNLKLLFCCKSEALADKLDQILMRNSIVS